MRKASDIRNKLRECWEVILSKKTDDIPSALKEKLIHLHRTIVVILFLGIALTGTMFIYGNILQAFSFFALTVILTAAFGIHDLSLTYMIKAGEYFIVPGTVSESFYERNIEATMGNLIGTKKGGYSMVFHPDEGTETFKVTVPRGSVEVADGSRIELYIKPDAIVIPGKKYSYFSSIISYGRST